MAQDILQQVDPEPIKITNYWKLVAIILSILLFASCFLLVIYFSKSCPEFNLSEDSGVTREVKTTDEQKTEFSCWDEYGYLCKEFYLLRDANGLAESQLFGFQFNKFHKDWECLNNGLNYTSDGITIHCQQKGCSASEEAGFPNVIQIDNSQECLDELENREYAQSVLPSFEINVSPVYFEDGQILNEVEGFIPNESTPKGNLYSFKITESTDNRETGWLKQYEVIFYSPKEISDSLSNYVGTSYGSEKIYAKYQIVVDVYEGTNPEKELSKEKFLNLIEQMIDSIKFLDQLDNL